MKRRPYTPSVARSRQARDESVLPRSGSTSTRAQTTETIADRNARIDRKMELARTLLSTLDPFEPRARLLASAILRRDAVLVDAVVAAEAPRAIADPPSLPERPRSR